MPKQNIRIRLKAYDHKLLDQSTVGDCKYSTKNRSKNSWTHTISNKKE